MRLHVKHVTNYEYDTPVDYTVQRLLLTPRPYAAQKILNWKVDAPGITTAMHYEDAFSNPVHLITSGKTSGSYAIVAEGLVEVDDVAGLVQGLNIRVPDHVFLRQTSSTQPSEAMLETLSKVTLKPGGTLNFLHELMAAIHERVTYETGTTHAQTTAAEAFAQGRGVCQDHTHVLIGLARASRIPARYITGYLMAGEDAPSPAAHAWAEALVPDLGWVGFDAANAKCPTDQYVRVATGLDALGDDARPGLPPGRRH